MCGHILSMISMALEFYERTIESSTFILATGLYIFCSFNPNLGIKLSLLLCLEAALLLSGEAF